VEIKLEQLESHILGLEKELLKPETRRSSERISELLAENFIEFCSSGKIYHYTIGDTWDEGSNSTQITWEIKDFGIRKLSPDIVLATYKVIKYSEKDKIKRYSLRSSIWKLINEDWKMIFHQGTLIGGNQEWR
jgi:hypothetical protein